jgi:hypothetical protein
VRRRLAWLVLIGLLGVAPAGARAQTYEASPDLIGVGGYVLFYDARGPLSFLAMTPRELPPGATVAGEVRGHACAYGLSVPIALSLDAIRVSGAYGMAGYEDALDGIRRDHPDLAGVFDVRVDDHTISLLGIFRRACTEVVARGFRLPGAPRS